MRAQQARAAALRDFERLVAEQDTYGDLLFADTQDVPGTEQQGAGQQGRATHGSGTHGSGTHKLMHFLKWYVRYNLPTSTTIPPCFVKT